MALRLALSMSHALQSKTMGWKFTSATIFAALKPRKELGFKRGIYVSMSKKHEFQMGINQGGKRWKVGSPLLRLEMQKKSYLTKRIGVEGLKSRVMLNASMKGR